MREYGYYWVQFYSGMWEVAYYGDTPSLITLGCAWWYIGESEGMMIDPILVGEKLERPK